MKWLTAARDLKRRKAREKQGLFVAEGVRTVEELARSPLGVEAVLLAARAAEDPRALAAARALEARGASYVELSDADFDSAADTDQPQGVLAIARAPERTLDALEIRDGARVLVLDAIQDPGNVGALVRTAAALGATAVVALPGTVDLWNAKVVRSAAGTHFRFPALDAAPAPLFAFLEQQRIALWGTAARATPLGEMTAPRRLAIAVGNEGAGLSEPVRARCASVVSLPIAPDVESLNVAIAAGIMLYALRS